MAKKQQTHTDLENDFYAGLAKSVGAELLDDLGRCSQFIDTGILGLNYLISGKFVGGGMPVGICAEIYGDSSTGKTLFGTNLLRGCQTADGVPIFLDVERTLNRTFAMKASHVDPRRVVVIEADTLERAFNRIFKIIRQARENLKVPMEKPILVVYDSIAASPSEREFAETSLDLEEASKAQIKEAGAGADKPGERAKICSKELRKLTPFLMENNATVLFINQVRKKIGVLFGSDEATAGGGMALPFYASARLKLESFRRLKDNNDRVFGINITVRSIKNKISTPFMSLRDLRLYFDKGIDPFGGLLELLKQIGRIEASGAAGTYKVKEPWAGGKEVKFKSSKERNDVPVATLMECPSLVDAQKAEEIEYYTQMFGDAVSAINDVSSEDEMIPDE